jgi:hypothetical protein
VNAPELDAAVAYTGQLLWPAFPLWPIRDGRCACPDPQCENAGKHPITKGWERSTASGDAVQACWAPHLGRRGIGFPPGRIDAWVLDIDTRHGADDELRDLLHGERLPETVVDATGGGGWHYLFRQPEHFRVRNWSLGRDSALHTRGDGGFVVLPPSLHRSGNAYRWLRSPFDHEIAPAPEWMLERLRNRSRGKIAPGGDDYLIPAGQRHEHLIRFGGLLRSCGCNKATVVACGLDFLRHQCQQEPEMDFALAEDQLRKAVDTWAGTYTPREER